MFLLFSRIIIEEAASNALKYGVAGSALCRVSYGPDPLPTTRNGPGAKSLFAGLTKGFGAANRNYLYITISSQNLRTVPKLGPSQLLSALRSDKHNVDRLFADQVG